MADRGMWSIIIASVNGSGYADTEADEHGVDGTRQTDRSAENCIEGSGQIKCRATMNGVDLTRQTDIGAHMA